MKIMKGRKEKTENKRTYILMLLIVMLMLICIIAICVVGVHSVRPKETAELNKDVEQQEEHISAAVDIAATSIGTNVKATFTVSTGDIYIYNSSSSGADATISKSSWYTFLKKIITADGNLDAVKSITFNDTIYAPEDSSNLFYPIISSTRYPLSKLTTINNINKLNTIKVKNMNEMFSYCSSLKNIDKWCLKGNDISMDSTFMGCSSLVNFSFYLDLEYKTVSNISYCFAGCSSLVSMDLSGLRWSSGGCSGRGLFSGCSSLTSVEFPNKSTSDLTVELSSFDNCSKLRTYRL